jgi:uncharacterized low-complexity protein
MKKSNKTPLALAIGGTLLSGLASTAVQAETFSTVNADPFKISELSAGYMQTAEAEKGEKKVEGSCGEGKCGGAMAKGSEEKTAEGKCAGDKPMPAAKKADKDSEGKCGEGKCGAM